MSKNINTSSGFEIGTASPVDERYVFQTLQERNNYNTHLLYHGLLCYVISEEQHYTYKGDGLWQQSIGNATAHIDDNEPANKDVIWIDSKDESVDRNPDTVLDIFREALSDLTQKVGALQSRFDHVIDPGLFPEPETETRLLRSNAAKTQRFMQQYSFYDDLPELPPGSNLVPPQSDPLPDAPLPPNSNLPTEKTPQPNANSLLIKRGYKADLPILSDGEFGYCKDTKELFIGANGSLVLINDAKSGTNENITTEYVDLLSPSKKTYRLSVTDQGQLQILDAEESNKPDPTPEEASLFKGLIVNSIYGGGFEMSNNTAVSHGYIELYNKTQNAFSLKGLSVHYGQFGQPWRTLNLVGTIPAETSFLIRCARHTESDNENLKYEITEYDMQWNIPLIDIGMKVYLSVGRSSPRSENPWASTGDVSSPVAEAGYIDMLAAGGEDITNTINGYELAYGHIMSRNTALRRSEFADTNNNLKDSIGFDYSAASLEQIQTYRPRSLKDGRWNIYFDKTKFDREKPNFMIIGFGTKADTSRTFTWQTIRTANLQFVWYRKRGATTWTQLPTTRRSVQYPDVDTYIMNAIAYNLTPGDYDYYVGEPIAEGSITSDTHTFTVFTNEKIKSSFKILQITDQQGINAAQYDAWSKSARYILDNESFDFVINTGVTSITILTAPLVA